MMRRDQENPVVDAGERQLKRYRLFRQGCYDRRRNVIDAYELLLREQVAQKWQLPLDFSVLTPEVFAQTVAEAIAHLPGKTKAMINLDHDQFVNRQMLQALVAVQQGAPQHQLIIELTERDAGLSILDTTLIDAAEFVTGQGLKLSLDDVGSGENQFEFLQPLLPFAVELKFALQNFNATAQDSYQQLVFWHQLALSEAKDFVLEGIESAADLALADRLAVNLLQGYYYERPQKFY